MRRARLLDLVLVLVDQVVQDGVRVAQLQGAHAHVDVLLLVELHDSEAVVLDLRILDDLHQATS